LDLLQGEARVNAKRPEDSAAHKAPLTAPTDREQRTPFPWPWGLVAIGVMALGWVGIYLVWNGVVFLFNL
jgi:hypothetical protein